MPDYNKISHRVIQELNNLIGSEYVIYNDHEKLLSYSHDEVADQSFASMPEVVVKPKNVNQISKILTLANRERIPVTPRGAGSGLSGGAVPVHGGIVLSIERMNRILEIDKDNFVAILEPGVITNDFIREVEKEGLFFAGYPMSLEMCYIGGNVAENAGGGRAIKYGVTGRYIIGLEIVMPTGEICTFGGKRVKDVTGYNIVQLMVGSEGTLGIFSKIYVKLIPLPKAKIDMLVLFEDIKSAINVVPLIMRDTRIVPTGIEFMDKLSIETASNYINEKKKFLDCGAILIIELDGNDPERIREDCLSIGDICLENGALDALIAEGPTDQDKMWKIRRCIAEAFNTMSREQSLEDIVVPVKNIPSLYPYLENISKKYNVLIPCYGHAGDGNLHATILKKKTMTSEKWSQILPLILHDLYKAVYELGGTISGEHGIGHKRKDYLPLVLTAEEIGIMKRIKKALDPYNILNPGKIFDID